MSDHLIAEAHRHAMALPTTHPTHADIAWYVREVSGLRAELALLREWQREVIQNANAHHAEREDAIARAERAEAEVKKLTGFYNEIVVECGHDRIVREYRQRGELLRDEANRRKEAEAELAAERAKVRVLRETCESICEEWGRNHDANPIGAGQRMETMASKMLEDMEDAQ